MLVCFITVSVENSSFSQLESLSQDIPKEMLLSKENVQLSNMLGEGLYPCTQHVYKDTAMET